MLIEIQEKLSQEETINENNISPIKAGQVMNVSADVSTIPIEQSLRVEKAATNDKTPKFAIRDTPQVNVMKSEMRHTDYDAQMVPQSEQVRNIQQFEEDKN